MLKVVGVEEGRGHILVNKLAAGERQLSAAIRLYFLEEDGLAIFTLANAAYGIFSDLLEKRGILEHDAPIAIIVKGI